jgi:hypothetical protein
VVMARVKLARQMPSAMTPATRNLSGAFFFIGDYLCDF